MVKCNENNSCHAKGSFPYQTSTSRKYKIIPTPCIDRRTVVRRYFDESWICKDFLISYYCFPHGSRFDWLSTYSPLLKIILWYYFPSAYDYIDDQFYHDGEILDFSESHLVASKHLTQIRTYFPETWIWHELTNIRLMRTNICIFESLLRWFACYHISHIAWSEELSISSTDCHLIKRENSNSFPYPVPSFLICKYSHGQQ